MIYRIYISKNGNYTQFGGNVKRRRMLEIVKRLEQDETNEKVLVIAHNIKLNYDEPIYLYTRKSIVKKLKM